MMDSNQVLINNVSSSIPTAADLELEIKVKKTTEKVAENLHIIANEPSLACFRLQEHIQKSLPQLVLKRLEVSQMHKDIQGKCYDLEYSINAVKSMNHSHDSFQRTKELLHRTILLKQQQRPVDAKPDRRKTSTAGSMYRRFSGSFDLPTSLLLPSAAVGTFGSSSYNRFGTSSASCHAPFSRAHSTSCESTPEKRTRTSHIAREHSLS